MERGKGAFWARLALRPSESGALVGPPTSAPTPFILLDLGARVQRPPPLEFTLGPCYCPSFLTSATLSSNKVIWKKHHWLPGGLPDSSFRALGGDSFLRGTTKRSALHRQFMALSGARAPRPLCGAPGLTPPAAPGSPIVPSLGRPGAAERLAALSHNRRQCAAADVSLSQARRNGEDVPRSGLRAHGIPTPPGRGGGTRTLGPPGGWGP